jgi:hypothetical protein
MKNSSWVLMRQNEEVTATLPKGLIALLPLLASGIFILFALTPLANAGLLTRIPSETEAGHQKINA